MADEMVSLASPPEQVDVVILTAIQEELQAVYEVFDSPAGWARFSVDGAPHKWTVLRADGLELTVVAVTAGKAGGNEMYAAVLRLAELRPRAVFLCGICAGRPGSVALGDVVVAEWSFDLASGKRTSEGFQRDGDSVEPFGKTLLSWARELASLEDHGWSRSVQSERPSQQPGLEQVAVRRSRAHVTPAVQSPSVEARAGLWGELNSYVRKAAMLDMESTSFYHATQAVKLPALVVKGVVDFADGDKNDLFHRYGAEAAARFVHALVHEYADRLRADLPSPAAASRTAPGHGLALTSLAPSPAAHRLAPALQHRLAPAGQAQARNQLTMRVRETISRLLQVSLGGETLLELELAGDIAAVRPRWDSGAHQLPASSGALLATFDALDGKLLVLGEPGSGKTTLLYELCLALVSRAERDPAQPVPVVLHLASWARHEQPRAAGLSSTLRLRLAGASWLERSLFRSGAPSWQSTGELLAAADPLTQWIVQELTRNYRVRSDATALQWLMDGAIVPLLDGLDELALADQERCAAAINQFCRAWRGQGPVVCCRREDYAALKVQLELLGAIVLRPLADQAIDNAIGPVGEDVAALNAVLQRDDVLRDMARSPLILNLLLRTYRGQAADELGPTHAMADRRTALFDAYVERMFAYRPLPHRRWTKPETMQYLSWLARKMSEHNQPEFSPDELNLAWLTPQERLRYFVMEGLFVGWLWGFLLPMLVWVFTLPFLVGSVEQKLWNLALWDFWTLPYTLFSASLTGAWIGYMAQRRPGEAAPLDGTKRDPWSWPLQSSWLVFGLLLV